MPDLQFQKVVQSNIDVLDFGVRDLEAIVTASGTILYSSTGYGGGVSSYFLSNGGSVSLVDTALFDLDADAGQGGEIEVVDGGDTLLVGGVAGGKVLRFDLVGLGQIGGMNEMNVAGSGSYAALAETDSGHILTADQAGSGVLTYTMGNNGLTLRNTEADTAASHAVHVSDVKLVTLSNGTEVLLSASQGERGISSYRMSGFDPVLADSMGPDEGAGIMIPTDMAVMQMGTLSFVIVASMPGSGNSGALTVMQIDGNGQLSVTDHVLDSLDMRFGAVQAIDTIEINGRWYVAAGGGDDGISLFVVLPGGTLQHLSTVEDSLTSTLDGVTAISLAFAGGDLQVFAASGAEGGISQFTYDLAGTGQTKLANANGQVLNGSSGHDILVGQGGNDRLQAGAGNDTLMGGDGRDTLSGGAGNDLYIITQDGVRDTITDFNPNQDTIDLSFWSFLYSTDSLDIVRIDGGVRITHRGESLDVLKGTNGSLNVEQVRDAITLGPARSIPIEFDEADDTTTSAAPSNDNDILQGTSGTDSLSAMLGDDTLYGWGGDDTLIGGYGDDLIFAGAGDDNLRGGRDADTIHGEAGNDFIQGQDGNDSITGGDGDNKLFGQRGDDTLVGGAGRDTLNSGGSSDLLIGGDGRDWFRAGNSEDTLFGGNGNDTMFGNSEDDILHGGPGFDRLFGGGGDDLILPGPDNDFIKGGTGADTFVFMPNMGRDQLLGFDRTEDTLRISSDLLSGQTNGWQVVQEYASVVGKDVVFDFGDGNQIVLLWGNNLGGLSDDIEII